jgi:hypothetical protein
MGPRKPDTTACHWNERRIVAVHVVLRAEHGGLTAAVRSARLEPVEKVLTGGPGDVWDGAG